jgi:hypothetical protein
MTDRATSVVAAKRPPIYSLAGRQWSRIERTLAMHPLRAFLLSMAAGLAVLFSGHGVASSMQPTPDARVGAGPIHVPAA